MTIDELQVLITANTSELKKELASVRGDLGKLDKTATGIGKRIPKSFGIMTTVASAFGNVIANVVTGAFRSLGNSVSGAVKRLDTLKNYPLVMQQLGYTAKDANKSIQVLGDRLLGLPTALDNIVSSTQQLAPLSPTLASATERALAFNNALLAGGKGAEGASRGMTQFTQMLATGKADMQSWKILMEVMPAQLDQLAKSLMGSGANASTLQQALMGGQVTMQEFADMAVKLNKEGGNGFSTFEEQARNATGGIGTSIANVKIAITRGLASIMDAIGQANIAGFFNGISRAISAVIPYVVAFVRVMIMAVGWIRTLFGGGKSQAKEMQDQVNETAGAVGDVAGGAGDVKEGLDGATGSAKKLKNQLAGFDEMNVLTEDSGSGGGGGSGGAGAGGGGVPMEFDFGGDDTGGIDKVQEKLEGLLSVFERIGEAGKTVWNSTPVQAFAGAVETSVGFLIELFKQVGSSIWENMVGTWDEIQPNVQLGINNVLDLWTLFWTQLDETIQTYGQDIIDGVVGLFDSVWQDAIDPIAQQMSQVWADATGSMLQAWKENGGEILDNMGQFVTNIVELFQSIWDNVIDPIITPFLEKLSDVWDNTIKDMVSEVQEFVLKLIKLALIIFNNVIAPIAKWLLRKLAPAFEIVGSVVSDVFDSILSVIGEVVKSVFGILNGLMDFLTGVFTGDWRKAWDGIKRIFSNIFDGIGAVAKFPLNVMIDLINGFIAGINKVKVPDWIPAVGGKSINIPKIPKLAKGGIIDEATLAVVGESGKEAVMPLENNTGWISQLAEQINKANGSDGQPMQITVKVGEDTLVRKIIDGIKDREYMTNEEVFA